MKNENIYERPYRAIYLGFILLSILAGVYYRFDIIESPSLFYLWLSLAIIGTIILFWGIAKHITYKVPKIHN